MNICDQNTSLYRDKIEFIQSILNTHCVISKDFIDKNNWIAMIIPENLEIIESEWLSNAIHRFGFTTYEQYIIENNDKIEFLEIINNQQNVYDSEYGFLDKRVILTNKNIDFMYYKNLDNLYHIFAGTYDFVFSCIQCTKQHCKEIYHEYYHQFMKDSKEFRECKYIWDLYQ